MKKIIAFLVVAAFTATVFPQQIQMGYATASGFTQGHPYRSGAYCWHNGYWGIHQGRNFYLTHNSNGQSLGKAERTAVGAAVGAGIASSISHDWRDAVAGAGVGGLIGYLTGKSHRSESRTSSWNTSSRGTRSRQPTRQNYYEIVPTFGANGPKTGNSTTPKINENLTLWNGTDAPITVHNRGAEVCQLEPGMTYRLTVPLGEIRLEAWAVVYNLVDDDRRGQSLAAKRVPLAIKVEDKLVKFVFP